MRFVHTRRFTRATPRPREWVGIHAAALAREPVVRSAFENAIRTAQQAVDQAAVQIALERLDAGSAAAAFPWATFARVLERGVLDGLREALAAGATHAARAVGELLEIRVEITKQEPLGAGQLAGSFTIKNPRADAWLARHGAELVRNVTIESQQALRAIVVNAYRRGVDVRGQAERIARVLRQGVGLTSRQAIALANLDDALEAQGIPTTQREAAVAARRERMIVQRSQMIARTETMIAAGHGQQEVWMQARDQGLLPTATTRRRWLAQPAVNDANPCPICAGLADQVRGLEEPFVSTYDGTTVMQPPAHPQCLCTTVLTFTD